MGAKWAELEETEGVTCGGSEGRGVSKKTSGRTAWATIWLGGGCGEEDRVASWGRRNEWRAAGGKKKTGERGG
ncbi:UNVERIFIED_CONTAM: hypothetical protein Slati_1937800 [Sesamum latifolium]|uniref:Uncharacterized protein n=1 Tax=Sesamum latifolium TaxID=2727402 RepID=A0AAW2X1U0_9LAMI